MGEDCEIQVSMWGVILPVIDSDRPGSSLWRVICKNWEHACMSRIYC